MNPNKLKSSIWKLDKDSLARIVEESASISEILLHFNLSNKGGNYKTLKRRLDFEKIDYSHIPQGKNHNKGLRYGGVSPLKNEEVFITNSTYSRFALKKRIIKQNLISYICSECNQIPVWKDKELCLVLDHINGVSNDNRIENLRFLCPNCNSQTNTFAGRNNKREKTIRVPKPKKPRPTKISWPDKEILLEMISSDGYSATGRTLGVSDNAVRKHLKKM